MTRAEQVKVAGQCLCGNESAPGGRRCETCRDAHRLRAKILRAKLINNEQCVKCRQPVGFHTLCEKCLEITRQRSAAWRTRKAIESRPGAARIKGQ